MNRRSDWSGLPRGIPQDDALSSILAFRKKIYLTLEELQSDLCGWIKEYNEQRPHPGRWCCGKTFLQTFIDSVPLKGENSSNMTR